jgi:hypothetical protein
MTSAARFRLFLAGTVFGAALAGFSQDDGQLAIRVEAREVVVPVFVFSKASASALFGGDWTQVEQDEEILGLTAKDFHIFEDGSEQEVRSLTAERVQDWWVRDNVSLHDERSCTPGGIWLGPDIPESAVAVRITQSSPLHIYLVSYIPPSSPTGSCHRINVKVDRPKGAAYGKLVVYARDEYCRAAHSLSDPLNGTKLGKQLEEYANAPRQGKIPLSVQTGLLFGNGGTGVVNVALEFPWKSLKHEWYDDDLYTSIGVLGLVYNKDGTVFSRFSDSPCLFGSSKRWEYCDHCARDKTSLDYVGIPGGYQTQISLPPGDYDLKVVLTDGAKFGRAETPLKVESDDRSTLSLSGIVLSKRSHEPLPGPSQYVRLVAGGQEFTAAADTQFKKGEALFAYLEVNEPLLATAPETKVQVRLKVSNAQTGELRVDTGFASVSALARRGKSVIPVAEQVAVDKLAPGSYRLDVQATDSAGRSTPWRTANFTVE